MSIGQSSRRIQSSNNYHYYPISSSISTIHDPLNNNTISFFTSIPLSVRNFIVLLQMDFFFSSWNYIRTQFVRLVWCLCVLCIVCRCRRYQLPLFIIPSWWIMKTNEIAFNTVQLQPQISSAGMGKLDILTWVHSAHCTEYTPQTNGLCLMRCASHIKWPTSCTKTNNNIYSKQKKSKIHMRNDYDWRSDVHKSESTSIFLVILWTWSMKSHNYIY